MKTITATITALLVLVGCTEAPKQQIVFSHEDTCKIIINDLQFGQANDTDRPCAIETDASSQKKTITVNFLSETCNAYRYTFSKPQENSEGVYVFRAEQNVPNPNCNFIAEYSDPNTPWVLNPE